MSSRPNLVLITTDQQRGDCLGLAGHPVVQTPYLDQMGAQGIHFRCGYSEHPQCIPARRTLMTGQTAARHGVPHNFNAPLEGPTLPGELTKAGYHTHLVGKLHLHPQRKLYGFMSADWSDGPYGKSAGDYARWLESEGIPARQIEAHGCNVNGWVARPWHLEERYHFTNWCTERAIDFLERRDPTVPFFLNLSYFHPHEPCTPPQNYWDRYIDAEHPDLIDAEWSHKKDEYESGLPVASWQTRLSPALLRQFRAGYYGCINHIDDQVSRVLSRLPQDTVVMFTSDHGEMLGDHQWIRKTRALEPSARVPFLMKLPKSLGIESGQTRTEVVAWQDIMPTLLDAAGVEIPETCEGRSILGLLRGEPWRERLHGEMAQCGGERTGMHFLTDGKGKYIWEPGLGRELFFDLEKDPGERANLAADPAWTDTVADWRADLIKRLEDRPEGFVKDGRLVIFDGPMPWARREYLEKGASIGGLVAMDPPKPTGLL